jgi:hypothetical protein
MAESTGEGVEIQIFIAKIYQIDVYEQELCYHCATYSLLKI